MITLDPNQQDTLHQKNQIMMMLDNDGSWSAGDIIPKEPDQYDAW